MAKKQNKMKNKLIGILLACLIISSCSKSVDLFEVRGGKVKITGNIENYKGVYKTGKITYFDAITRDFRDEVFPIDSVGNFSFSFTLAHPLLNSAYFDVEGHYYGEFLIRPNTDYNLSFIANKIRFNDKSKEENTQIAAFYRAMKSSLGDKIHKAERLHKKGLSIAEYIKFQKQLEVEKTTFLNSYCKQNTVSSKIKSILASEIKFKTAHFIITYRFDYSKGYPSPRKKLPKDFYTNLFKEYSIQNGYDFQTRKCVDYLSIL